MNPKLPLDVNAWGPKHQCVSNQSRAAFVQSHCQSQSG